MFAKKLVIRFGQHVCRIRKRGHPTTIDQLRVPANVIRVQMRTQHVIHVVYCRSSRGKGTHKTRAFALMPLGHARHSFVISHARIHKDQMIRCFQQEALDRQDQLA